MDRREFLRFSSIAALAVYTRPLDGLRIGSSAVRQVAPKRITMPVLSCIYIFMYLRWGKAETCAFIGMLHRSQKPVEGHVRESNRGSTPGGACAHHSGVPGRQGNSASSVRVGRFHPHGEQMAKALRATGLGGFAGSSAVGQASAVWGGVSRPRFSLIGTAAEKYSHGDAGEAAQPSETDQTKATSAPANPAPRGMAHGDGPAVARQLGASVHAVWRALRREVIYLQRLRTWWVIVPIRSLPPKPPRGWDCIGIRR
jgi:hypothetical protein